MAAKTKWGAVKDHLSAAPTPDPDAALEANLENADPELCIRLLQVRHLLNDRMFESAAPSARLLHVF